LKKTALSVMKTVSLFEAVSRTQWRNSRLVILGYHGISFEDEHEWDPSYFVTRGLLGQRLEWLKAEGFSVLPLETAIGALFSGELPERSVVLTFDDGFYNFYKLGHPLLAAYGVPSTVYLTTYYSEDNRPVLGVTASYMLWKRRKRTVRIAAVPEVSQTLDLSRRETRDAVVTALQTHAASAGFGADEKHALLRSLAADIGFDFETFCESRLLNLMTPAEAREISAAGVDIQLHTHRHRTPMDETLFRREIQDNATRIEDITGRIPRHFCYPSGVYDPTFLPWLRKLGIASAVTCDPGICSRDANPLLLPRFLDTCGVSQTDFESWVSGALPLLYSGIKPNGGRTRRGGGASASTKPSDA
jgi:peptidoglycan/xylan/chitin deacetylase (PgdA/CDA1 family)